MIPLLLPQANKGCHGKQAQEAEEISARADVHVHQSSEVKFSFIFCHFEVSSCTQQQSASYWHRLSNVIKRQFSQAVLPNSTIITWHLGTEWLALSHTRLVFASRSLAWIIIISRARQEYLQPKWLHHKQEHRAHFRFWNWPVSDDNYGQSSTVSLEGQYFLLITIRHNCLLSLVQNRCCYDAWGQLDFLNIKPSLAVVMMKILTE